MRSHAFITALAYLAVNPLAWTTHAEETFRLTCRVLDSSGEAIEGVAARLREMPEQSTSLRERSDAAEVNAFEGCLVYG